MTSIYSCSLAHSLGHRLLQVVSHETAVAYDGKETQWDCCPLASTGRWKFLTGTGGT